MKTQILRMPNKQSTDLILVQGRIRSCQACGLAKGRRNAVPGAGFSDADVVLVGESPGFKEDQTGKPFVGEAGEFLDVLLGEARLKRRSVFIMNTINCRPPRNRDPKQDELKQCNRWLVEQIAIVKPKVILAMGRFASLSFVPELRPRDIRGTARKQDGRTYFFTYHPAAALHNPALRTELLREFKDFGDVLDHVLDR